MLDLFGRGYVIEHCIAAIRKKSEERAYQAYITDALRMTAKNTAAYAGGIFPKTRWLDVIDTPLPPPPENTRPCSEIAADMWKRIRGEKQ